MPATRTQVNVRIPVDLHETVKAVAEVDGSNVSELMIEALQDLVDKRKGDPEWQERHREWASRQKALLKALSPPRR